MLEVGDKVRIISGNDIVQINSIGMIGIIRGMRHSNGADVRLEDGNEFYYKLSMLKLLN